jgi:ribonuclease P protein component
MKTGPEDGRATAGDAAGMVGASCPDSHQPVAVSVVASALRRTQKLPASQRLRAAADFDAMRRTGRRIETGPFTLRWRLRGEGLRRFGVVASRKVGGAVQRNRAKRILRDLFRRNQDAWPVACDIVAIVRPNFFDFSFSALRERYLHAAQQASRPTTKGTHARH